MPLPHSRRKSFYRKWVLTGVSVLALGGCLLTIWIQLQIGPLPKHLPPPSVATIDEKGEIAIRISGATFLTRLAVLYDELFAYLMYQHYASSPPFSNQEILLRYMSHRNPPEYEIVAVLTDDFLAATDRAVYLSNSTGTDLNWRAVIQRSLTDYRNQTMLFSSAYNLPVRKKMEALSKLELAALLRRFIRFKSTTDPRVRRRLEPVPKILTSEEAQRLAGDIIAVAEFYELPLEFLIGIGAIENNYMAIRGDLKHSVWKRRAARDDIILERRNGRVRVLNDSAGVWQITRETLRFAHKLFLKDKRDYGRLPEHLRPAKELNVNEVKLDILTTYAGLLLEDLLDHFNGDVSLAIGAYNGGPQSPNLRYEKGVQAAAAHARNVLEQAAALNGESVMKTSWLMPR